MILVTGLDGSGKSTLLNSIESNFGEQIEILRFPTFESEKYSSDNELYNCCQFINRIGEKSDADKNPSLKIISMFCAVLLFDEIYALIQKTEDKFIICERHPAIDTFVYAKAYYRVMRPELLDAAIATEIEKTYETELTKILKNIKVEIPISGKGKLFDLLNFLYQWFSDIENFEVAQLQQLFEFKIPETIYFLDAPTEVLVARLSQRSSREYHEAENHLSKMRTVYLETLNKLGVPFQIVDTSNFDGTNQLIDQLMAQLK